MEKDFLDNILEVIENKDADKLKVILEDMHPADIAELCDELDVDEARLVYRQLDNETAADVLVEMDEDNRKRLRPNAVPLTHSPSSPSARTPPSLMSFTAAASWPGLFSKNTDSCVIAMMI